MKERSSYVDEYRGMSPPLQNLEMKKLFDLLPNFNSVFEDTDRDYLDMSSINQTIEQLEKRKKSIWRQDLFVRLDALLSIADITDSFRFWIINRYANEMEYGVTKTETEEGLRDVEVVSDSARNTRLFQWDNPQSGGIYDKEKRKDIEAEAFSSEFQLQLTSRKVEEKMEEFVENNFDFTETIFKEIEDNKLERLFMSETEQRELNASEQKQVLRVRDLMENVRKEKELPSRWLRDYVEKYHEEPPCLTR